MNDKVKILFVALPLAAMLGASSPSYAFFEKSKEVRFSDVPSSAQATINSYIDGGKIDEVRQENKNGNLVYETKIKKPTAGALSLKSRPTGASLNSSTATNSLKITSRFRTCRKRPGRSSTLSPKAPISTVSFAKHGTERPITRRGPRPTTIALSR